MPDICCNEDDLRRGRELAPPGSQIYCRVLCHHRELPNIFKTVRLINQARIFKLDPVTQVDVFFVK